jgi:hypothetical protein
VIPGLNLEDARKWVAERGNGSQTLAAFRGKFSVAQALGLQDNLLSVASDYFQVESERRIRSGAATIFGALPTAGAELAAAAMAATILKHRPLERDLS